MVVLWCVFRCFREREWKYHRGVSNQCKEVWGMNGGKGIMIKMTIQTTRNGIDPPHSLSLS